MITLILAGLAYGAPITAHFCGMSAFNYGDVAGVNDLEDYYANNSADKRIRGVHITVYKLSGGNPLNNYVFKGYTAWSGSRKGCTPDLTVDDGEPYILQLTSKGLSRDEYIVVRNPSNQIVTLSTVLVPTAGKNKLTSDTTTREWGYLAALSRAISRKSYGLPAGKLIEVRQDSGSYFNATTGVLHLTTDSKFVMAHELGHWVAWTADEELSSKDSYAAPSDGCRYDPEHDDHSMQSKEYQSAASSEGFAHFISAVSWNRLTDADCWFSYNKDLDWDHDKSNDPQQISCESASPTSNTPMPGGDYFGFIHGLSGVSWACTGSTWNRAMEYDWLRFFWDVAHVGTVRDVVDTWDAANPHNWTQDDSPPIPPAMGYPYTELRSHTTLPLSTWDAFAAYNGVNR